MNTANREDEHDKLRADPNEAHAMRRIPVSGNCIDSRDIFAGTREITIVHGAETYRLRLTAQNKLILTK
jgi:hemin uptake protein HemP